MVSLRKSYNSDHYCGGVLISGNRDQIILILHHVFERKSRDRTIITEAPIKVREYTGCTLNSRGTNGVLSAIFPFWAKMKIVITASRDDFCENFLARN